jgi:GNAT superfamily N-acetyltransferase
MANRSHMLKVDSGFTIREATSADSSAIAGLISELGYPTTEPDMRARFTAIEADANYRTFVAEVAAVVAGVAGAGLAPYYERNGIYGRILVLAVGEAYRRNGLGRALVNAAEAWAASQGAIAMLVNTAHHRKNAHQFYGQIGYSSTGLRFVKELPCERHGPA